MKTTTLDTLSERLREAIKSAKISQSQLAEKVGIAQPSIAKILSGKTKNPSNMVEIAVALGVRPEWLAMNMGPMHYDGESEYDGIAPPPRSTPAVYVPLWDGEKQTNQYVMSPKEVTNTHCRAYTLPRDTGFDGFTAGTTIVIDTKMRAETNDYVYASVNGSFSVYRFLVNDGDGLLMLPVVGVPPLPVKDSTKVIGVIVFFSRKVKSS